MAPVAIAGMVAPTVGKPAPLAGTVAAPTGGTATGTAAPGTPGTPKIGNAAPLFAGVSEIDFIVVVVIIVVGGADDVFIVVVIIVVGLEAAVALFPVIIDNAPILGLGAARPGF